MSAHTPGEWFIRDATKVELKIFARGECISGVVASVNTGWPHADQQAEQRANARLIAAAPELLAALQAMLIAVRKITGEYPTGYDGYECESMAERAIEKATGAPA